MAVTGVIHDRLQQDLAAILIALNLQGSKDGKGNTVTGNVGTNVYTEQTFDESNVKYPCIVLCYEDESEEDDDEAANFEEDGVIYPIRLLICDRTSQRWQDSRPDYLRWRWTVSQVLLGLDANPGFFPDVPECWGIRLRRLKIYDPQAPKYQFMVSGMVVLCRTVTPRWRGGEQPT